MVVLEAYDGRGFGWGEYIIVHSGNYEKYSEFMSFLVANPKERLDEIVEALGYKVKRRWSNATSEFVELNARSASKVASAISKLLS